MPAQNFTVNGQPVSVDAPDDMATLWVLRDKLGITGPKYGCGSNVCKACACHINGKAATVCSIPVASVRGQSITTIEGLADTAVAAGRAVDGLHIVQKVWLEMDVAQCGFCQPGQIMAAVDLLKRTKTPSDADIDAIENMCRCGTYGRVRAAIKVAASRMP